MFFCCVQMLWEASHTPNKGEVRRHNNHEEIETMLLRRENRRLVLKIKYRRVWRVWKEYFPNDGDTIEDGDVDDAGESEPDEAAAAEVGPNRRNQLTGPAHLIDLFAASHGNIELPQLRASLRDAYRSVHVPVPDLSEAKFYTSALLQGRIRVRTEAPGRSTRFSEVRLHTRQQRREPEWATVLCFFETIDGRPWAYVQPYSFEFLCELTSAPVVIQDEAAVILPLDAIAHPVLIMPFPLQVRRNAADGVQRYWICWWTATGFLKYDQEARFNLLRTYNQELLKSILFNILRH